eukprot:jgi/Hompol1/4083/HPOL_006922-RA
MGLLLNALPPPSWSDGVQATPPPSYTVADPEKLHSLLLSLTPKVTEAYQQAPSKCFIDPSSRHTTFIELQGIHFTPGALLAALPRNYQLFQCNSPSGLKLCIGGHPT